MNIVYIQEQETESSLSDESVCVVSNEYWFSAVHLHTVYCGALLPKFRNFIIKCMPFCRARLAENLA